MGEALRIEVECTLGPQGEVPRRIRLGGRSLGMSEVLDRWPGQRLHDFKLRGEDGAVYILRHQLDDDCWSLLLYDSGRRPETRLSST